MYGGSEVEWWSGFGEDCGGDVDGGCQESRHGGGGDGGGCGDGGN